MKITDIIERLWVDPDNQDGISLSIKAAMRRISVLAPDKRIMLTVLHELPLEIAGYSMYRLLDHLAENHGFILFDHENIEDYAFLAEAVDNDWESVQYVVDRFARDYLEDKGVTLEE